jgi:hypothetical protein
VLVYTAAAGDDNGSKLGWSSCGFLCDLLQNGRVYPFGLVKAQVAGGFGFVLCLVEVCPIDFYIFVCLSTVVFFF